MLTAFGCEGDTIRHIRLIQHNPHMKPYELFLFVLLGISIGLGITLQTGINASLKQVLGSPVYAAFCSFALGTAVLAVLCLSIAFKPSTSPVPPLHTVPAWLWWGGVLGAFNIALSIYLAPRLGALLLSVSIVLGQLIAASMFDHMGWLGYPKTPINGWRILGITLVLLGLFCIQHTPKSVR